MGYTHYMPQRRTFTDAEWGAIGEAVVTLLVHLPERVVLADGMGDPGTKPEVSATRIWLNGRAPLDYETFCVPREHQPQEWERGDTAYPFGFNCCKTARKPYDVVVTGILIAIERIAPGALDIASDGDAGEWVDGLRWVRAVLGDSAHYRYTIPSGVRGATAFNNADLLLAGMMKEE